MSTSAHECKSYLANNVARDIANSLFQKWAVKGFFPAGERSEPRSRTARRAPADRSPRRIATWAASGVAVPRAFFGTFFRFERKYFPPRGGSPTTRAVAGASIPHRGKGDCACGRPKGFLLTLWKPSGTEGGEKTHGTASPTPASKSARQTPARGRFEASFFRGQ